MSTRVTLCACLLLTAAPYVQAQCTNDYILVSTTDILGGTASSSTLDPVTKTATLNVETLSGLPTLRVFGGRVFVLGDDNKLRILDPCNNFDALFFPFATGNPSTPRDLVQLSPTLVYITRYERSTILKINPSTGAFAGEFNLAALADADGLPEMNQMFAYGGRLYVCLERTTHTNNLPTGTSMLAVIDIVTETLVDVDPVAAGIQGIPLALQRPLSEINFRVIGDAPKAYFGCIGIQASLDGGVVECDASDPFDQSVILTEANAGGDIIDVEIISDVKGFALVLTPAGATDLIAFNPSTGAKIGATMLSVPPGFRNLTDIEPSSLGLLVADLNWGGGPAGIRCFDMTTNTEIPAGPISMGLPPFDIVIKKGSTTDSDLARFATALGQNYPNPFNPETSIPFSLATDSRVRLRIYDVTGALVATLIDEQRDAGVHVARWNGRTDSGDTSPTGVYFARLQAGTAVDTRKLVLLK